MVDNASGDGIASRLARRVPSARVLEELVNRGYGSACNRGARETRRPLLLFLNSDAYVRSGSVEALVRALDADEGAAAAGPRLLETDGQPPALHPPAAVAVEDLLRELGPRVSRGRTRALRGSHADARRPRPRPDGRGADGRRADGAPHGLRGGGRLRRGLLPLRRGDRPDGEVAARRLAAPLRAAGGGRSRGRPLRRRPPLRPPPRVARAIRLASTTAPRPERSRASSWPPERRSDTRRRSSRPGETGRRRRARYRAALSGAPPPDARPGGSTGRTG